jgi:hypothetical protein
METAMADAVLYPSGEDRVCAAVALGWQVAVLYHSPVHRGPVEDPPRAARLPGYSGFSPATHARWLGEQIASTAGRLVTDPPQALTEALSAALAWLDAADRERETTLNAIFTLHCRLLEALYVTDFRLGKAYGLGRALAETSLVPARADGDGTAAAFRVLLASGRVNTLNDWLVELKTLLPDHAAYAVTSGLRDWRDWVAKQPAAADWPSAQKAMRTQGYLWRGLVTGEKAATDMLNLSGYLAAARQIAWRFRLVILLAVLAAVGVVGTLVLLPGISPTARLLAALAWVGATIAAAMRASGALFGSAVKGAEGWLWQTELDESVAQAATRLPPPARPRRITGSAAGAMALSGTEPHPAGELPAAPAAT